MRVDIRFRGFKGSEALRAYALRRIQLQLSRFGHQLNAVVVRVTDINGPRGGLDKQCQVTVSGPKIGTSSLVELSGNAYASVDTALERIGRALTREFSRVQNWKTTRALGRGAV